MASEYNLKLKAQLDLSDAQAQINRLNTQSNSGVGGAVGGNVPSFSNLENSLNSLKSAITTLTEKLNTTNSKLGGTNNQSGYIQNGGGPARSSDIGDIVKMMGLLHFSKQIAGDVLNPQRSAWEAGASAAINTASGAAMGGMAGKRFGPIGMAVGAIGGALVTGYSEVSKAFNEDSEYEKSLKEAQAKFNEFGKKLAHNQDLDNIRDAIDRGVDYTSYLKGKIEEVNKSNKWYADNWDQIAQQGQESMQAATKTLNANIEAKKEYETLLRLSEAKQKALKDEREAREKELNNIQSSIQNFNRNTDFDKSVAGVNRMISNNKLDDINKAPESINNLMSIFDTLNSAAEKRREDMKDAESVLNQASTPEQYNEALKQYNTSQNELNQIGGLMSSIQTKIADFDKQFSTVEKLPGVKASEISSLAAIGGGGYNITEMGVGGVRSTNIKIERSNELLDTIDKTIRGIDEYLKSTNFSNGATFQ